MRDYSSEGLCLEFNFGPQADCHKRYWGLCLSCGLGTYSDESELQDLKETACRRIRNRWETMSGFSGESPPATHADYQPSRKQGCRVLLKFHIPHQTAPVGTLGALCQTLYVHVCIHTLYISQIPLNPGRGLWLRVSALNNFKHVTHTPTRIAMLLPENSGIPAITPITVAFIINGIPAITPITQWPL